MSPAKKSLVRSALLFALVFAVLAWPWPGWGRVFCAAYARTAQAIVAPALRVEGVTFRASVPGDRFDPWDLLVRFPPAPDTTSVHGVRIQIRRIAYLPIAFLLALAVACPARDRKRLAYAVAGCALGLLVLQAVGLLSVFTARRALELGAPLDVAVSALSQALIAPPGMSYAVPGVLWAVLARPFDGLLATLRRSSAGA